ncbi:hypothetical protein [Candidatus Wolbachia massiliensis]|uniref:Uncharacterized protein n=1 Tax=Candidatus Wolbachia massiliensis TaxID=1845000 RepID=A0A7L7YLH7_9RICK|nr:hypothetical protein [Candidatus Wolbachia massiliensis]QOD38110.1 hypothetical protein ID128_04835 [Candidatus Wolbachia massiliensis]
MAEVKKNPIVTLKAQAKKFDFNKLRATEDNQEANSGATMYKDFPRMNFIINGKSIDKASINTLIEKAWKQHAWRGFNKNLIDEKTNTYGKKSYNSEDQVSILKEEVRKNENYRPIAKEIFKEMFQHAGAKAPNDPILEELVTNCNQSSYYGGGLVINVFAPAFLSHELMPHVPQGQGVIHINCTDRNCISIKSNSEMLITDTKLLANCDDPEEAVICQLNSSLEFTLESQGDKDGVTYRNGKLSLTVPEELKNYQGEDDKSLFDIIQEYFQRFCEKLGFKFEANTQIERNLRKQLKVDSHLEGLKPPVHSGEHVRGA